MSVESTAGKVAEGVEVGIKAPRFSWARIAAGVGVFLVLGGVSVRFYQQSFDGLWDREAIDQAQVAAAVAGGQGFITRFVRPLNVELVPEGRTKVTELNHAPIYPYVLAAAFRLRSVSDQVVAWTSLAFLLATLVATCVLGRILFDWRTGLLAASALGVSAPILRAGMVGQQWTLAALWFALLMIAVALHHKAASDGRAMAGAVCAAVAAVCAALLYMTHHILVFLAIPVAAYFAVTGSWRKLHAAIFVVAMVVLIAPWSYRNALYTGFPVLGVNAWDLMAHSDAYPADTLYRSTDEGNCELSKVLLFPVERFSAFAHKLISGSSEMLSATVGVLGLGILAFLLVSVLYRFKNPSANAVRGLIYGVMPVAIVCFALYSVGTNAVIIFAPVAAVFSSAYLLLLLDARKLHAFFRRVLVGCFVLLMANQTIAPLMWRAAAEPNEGRNAVAHSYFSMISSRGARIAVYTDAPWIAAWRWRAWAAWLPTSDVDFLALTAMGFPLRVIILTPESENYAPDEIWYVLHKVRLWREYIKDANEGLKQILQAARVSPSDRTAAQKYIERLRREFAVSRSLEDFAGQPSDPLAPDDVQVLTREGSGAARF